MTLSRRGWGLAGLLWLLLALAQAPGLTVADTKHDLTANPWGFLTQALSPWTDVFPLGQLQNQAYGYLFPQGLFFALLDPVPDWLTQRLWWALLLFLAFAGVVRLLEATGTGSRVSRLVAGVLFALGPRILTTLGAISSEAWTVALVPWIMLPVVRVLLPGPTHGPATQPTTRRLAAAGLGSAMVVLCLGAVNAVATLAAVVPAVLWWLTQGVFATAGGAGSAAEAAQRRRTAWRLAAWWVPGGVLACFWWVGPLLVLGRYSPPFTDYIEASGLTTHWFNLGEVLRGATSWTAFLSTERQAGFAVATEAVFVAATVAVALLGLAGLAGARGRMPFAGSWLVVLGAGLAVFGVAATPFSPVAEQVQAFLDGAGAPLRNLHKFDALVHLPLVAGVAHLLGGLTVPRDAAAWRHPEKNRPVVVTTAVVLVVAAATAPAWSGRLVPQDGYRAVPSSWQQAADWLNDPAHGAGDTRTMILPEARSARQTWGNTRDEPAQALLDVPWVVRDAVPLVPPEAIRGLDGLQREFAAEGASGANPALADALLQQGVGYLLVRTDLARAADTPGARVVLNTLTRSAAADGFTEVADFGGGDIRIFRVDGQADGQAGAGVPTGTRVVGAGDLEVTAGGPEVLPRLAAADAAAGRGPRDRILVQDVPDGLTGAAGPVGRSPETVTDTPALREHNYGNVTGAESDIRAADDARSTRNPVRDYPTGLADSDLTQVRERGGRVTASSSAADPTSLNGAEPYSGPSAAVDGVGETAWRPGTGSPVNQTLTLELDRPRSQMSLSARTPGSPLRVQVTTYLDDETVASTTTLVPGYREADTTVRPVVLPSGEADRVELRIVGSWGDAGLSEVTLTELDSGRDVTPRRDIVVPATDQTPRRWVLGQEVYEFEMRRTITVPGSGPVPVTVTSDRCAAGRQTVSTVDGVPVACGDRVLLDPGGHEVRSRDRWVSLDVQDSAAGGTGTDGAGSADSGGSADGGDWVVVTSTAVNPGRAAELEGTALAPVTVNGWQQGWVVPAGAAAGMSDAEIASAVDVRFTATDTYQRWLGAGLVGAMVLLAAWLFAWWPGRRTPGERLKAEGPGGRVGPSGRVLVGAGVLALCAGIAGFPGVVVGAVTTALVVGVPAAVRRLPARSAASRAVRALCRLTRPVTLAMLLGGAGAVLMVRGPWGGDYAGYSWVTQLLFLGCVVATVCGAAGGGRAGRS
ncbi:alpha-(1-_3)-arabinofuranosyltransferase domain-containing protein [Corynebacterium kalidii]